MRIDGKEVAIFSIATILGIVTGTGILENSAKSLVEVLSQGNTSDLISTPENNRLILSRNDPYVNTPQTDQVFRRELIWEWNNK